MNDIEHCSRNESSTVEKQGLRLPNGQGMEALFSTKSTSEKCGAFLISGGGFEIANQSFGLIEPFDGKPLCT